MAKHAPRHQKDGFELLKPLPRERLDAPWFGGTYADEAGQLTFKRDGTATLDGERGQWSIEARQLAVVTPTRTCEGALGPDSAVVRCAWLDGSNPRAVRVLTFYAD